MNAKEYEKTGTLHALVASTVLEKASRFGARSPAFGESFYGNDVEAVVVDLEDDHHHYEITVKRVRRKH